jgi:hypothetical protein
MEGNQANRRTGLQTMKTTNVMAFAHYMTKRTLTRLGGAYNRPYAQFLKCALQDAHRFNRRGELNARYTEILAVDVRITEERSVVRKVVAKAISLGYMVSLYCDGDVLVGKETNVANVMKHVQSCDMEALVIRDMNDQRIGAVQMVYGNCASEVLSDWSDNAAIEAIIAPALLKCDRLSALGR